MSRDDAVLVTPSEPAGAAPAAPREPAVVHDPPPTASAHEGPTLPSTNSLCPEPSIGAQEDPVFVAYVGTTEVGAASHINTVTTSGSAAILAPYDATFAPHEYSVQVRVLWGRGLC